MQQHNYRRVDNTVATNLSHYFPNSISSEVKYEEKNIAKHAEHWYACIFDYIALHVSWVCTVHFFIAYFILCAPP